MCRGREGGRGRERLDIRWAGEDRKERFFIPTIGVPGLSSVWECVDDHETIRDLPGIPGSSTGLLSPHQSTAAPSLARATAGDRLGFSVDFLVQNLLLSDSLSPRQADR